MSNTLKNRTFADSVRTGLFKTIVNTRKAAKAAQQYSKKATAAAKYHSKDLKSVAKQAWHTNI